VIKFVNLKQPQILQEFELIKCSCGVFWQLAGSDANKDAIVSSGGLNQIIALMSAFQEEPAVLQEVRILFPS